MSTTLALALDAPLSLAQRYHRANLRRTAVLLLLGAALCLSLLWDVATGPSGLPLRDIVQGLLAPESLEVADRVILFDVRLPYTCMALVVGAALGLAGAQMQTVLNNPLASPFTLGLAAAATLGAAMAIVFVPVLPWLPVELLTPLCAFLMALLSTGLILLLLRWHGGGSHSLVLFGIALMFALEALVSLMHFLADSNALEQIVFWSMGSLGRASWPNVLLVAVTLLLCFGLAMRRAWALTLLRSGEAQAESLGVDVTRVRRACLVEVSLLTAVALCFVGTIGFVGLVGPHIARLLVGEQHRYFLPASTLCGALMLSLASIASKSLIPGLIVPIGIVTALVGVPAFMLLILGRRAAA
ncbi:FecCD family ABC transporter permease [Vogesella indigofera]|uniref:Iron ABC transporter permease n=1 Tax=Vogesella indigofera TaxID=45465 RepID=A0ABT5I3Q8_VOGIN|nr:iron ABC transporter permease [Vogesella indigofera]MDC7690800.1 iron ABC transporter permease [Vogesella indigofera]